MLCAALRSDLEPLRNIFDSLARVEGILLLFSVIGLKGAVFKVFVQTEEGGGRPKA